MNPYGWQSLRSELELWQQVGIPLTLWWRDDDAIAATGQLETLLSLSERFNLPLSLAVIPASLQPSLPSRLKKTTLISCLLHGFSHQNHASSGQRKQELGDHRSQDEIIRELRLGDSLLQDAFDKKYVPALVPPWNRVSDKLVAELHDMGLCGLSTLGPRATLQSPAGSPVINNVHIDIINWKQQCFAGDAAIIKQIVEHLSARREGLVDPSEVTGIMTHHLVHDDKSWQFLNQLFEELSRYDWIKWPSAQQIFNHQNQ